MCMWGRGGQLDGQCTGYTQALLKYVCLMIMNYKLILKTDEKQKSKLEGVLKVKWPSSEVH